MEKQFKHTYFYLRYTKHDPATWRAMELIFNIHRTNINKTFKKYKLYVGL